MPQELQQFGQRIRAYNVEARVDGSWQPFSAGTSVGNKRIDVAAGAVAADQLRLTVTASTALPVIGNFAVFKPCPTM